METWNILSLIPIQIKSIPFGEKQDNFSFVLAEHWRIFLFPNGENKSERKEPDVLERDSEVLLKNGDNFKKELLFTNVSPTSVFVDVYFLSPVIFSFFVRFEVS